MTEERPILKLKYSIAEKIIFVLTVIVLILNFIFVIIYWKDMPSTIPIHFDFSGKPNGWGGRGTLLVLPIINLFLFILLALLSKFPHIGNYPVNITEKNAKYQYNNARKLMIVMNLEIVCLFFYISLSEIYLALGKINGPGILFLPVFLLVILGTTAYFTIKMYRNKPSNT
ncbi:MAG: DUF1648 domain-containing protein [Clostridium sp.]|uniref:DUF1648 domain-containing protein n=1 Tax=Clostridium sp. TaxID=1506 RepID=UPI0039EA7D46